MKKYPCRIIEVTRDSVIFEMIKDLKNKIVDTRKVSKERFRGRKGLEQGKLFFLRLNHISIANGFGHTETIIWEADGKINPEDFDFKFPENILKDFDFSRLNKH